MSDDEDLFQSYGPYVSDIEGFKQVRNDLREDLRHGISQKRMQNPQERYVSFSFELDECTEAPNIYHLCLTEANRNSSPVWGVRPLEYMESRSPENDLPRFYHQAESDFEGDGVPVEVVMDIQCRMKAAMILAMADLDAEGFFGTGGERERIQLRCGTYTHEGGSDLGFTAWTVRYLNPASQFQSFLEGLKQTDQADWLDRQADELSCEDRMLYYIQQG